MLFNGCNADQLSSEPSSFQITVSTDTEWGTTVCFHIKSSLSASETHMADKYTFKKMKKMEWE